MGGRVTVPLGTLYHATKFAVEGLSEALQYELGPLGVPVKIVEPGGIMTDFGGRSMDSTNDPDLTEYQALVRNVDAAMGSLMANGSTPELVAEVILRATTAGTDQLRYEAGDDAVALLAHRRSADDATFFADLREQFGLSRASGRPQARRTVARDTNPTEDLP